MERHVSAPLPWWGLAALIGVSFAVLALMVVLGAGRQPEPPEPDQAHDDAVIAQLEDQFKE
jgi:hypothetical protein